MSGTMEWSHYNDHPRTILHIDMDCFYAQVEMLRNPELRHVPLGIKQKNIVVTCNYIARSQGVEKLMLLSKAKKKCPSLVLVSGEDLINYRHASSRIHDLLLTYTSKVEKLGLDENYLDISELVRTREHMQSEDVVVGHSVGCAEDKCSCGCHERLAIGSQIASEIRERLLKDLGFTSCCGISFNKLLAKLVGSKHKPNQQTTLFPNGVDAFMLSLNQVHRIPGIGTRTKHQLRSIGVGTIADLRAIDEGKLRTLVGRETAVLFKNWSHGVDAAEVKSSGKPQTIGIEDGFRMICMESEVKEKFRVLLLRLMTLVAEDGRVPMTVKVTVRKLDVVQGTSHNGSKQAPVPAGIFTSPPGQLSEDGTAKLLTIIMALFNRIINIAKPFHLTLLGLAFTKFREELGNQSIASFLLKKRDISVQSLTTFMSNATLGEACELSIPSCSKNESESEAEPSPKKTKQESSKKRKFAEDPNLWSPSKLKVGELNLDGDDDCPNDVDPEVFRELPYHVQQELLQDWRLAKRPITTHSSTGPRIMVCSRQQKTAQRKLRNLTLLEMLSRHREIQTLK